MMAGAKASKCTGEEGGKENGSARSASGFVTARRGATGEWIVLVLDAQRADTYQAWTFAETQERLCATRGMSIR